MICVLDVSGMFICTLQPIVSEKFNFAVLPISEMGSLLVGGAAGRSKMGVAAGKTCQSGISHPNDMTLSKSHRPKNRPEAASNHTSGI